MSMWREFVRTGVILCAAAMLLSGIQVQAAQQSEHAGDAEAQEAAQEQKEAAQEKKEAEQDRLEQMQDLYDQGRDALDEAHYREAEQTFGELAKMNGPQTDAALYWKAYSQNREGKKEAALASIADLKKRFPQSRWKKDAEALEIEVRSSTGSKTNPDAESDDDLKLLALQGLMNNNPEKALPILEGVLNGTASPRVKSKALFVLAQSGSPEAREQMAKIARGQSNPDLQRKAVRVPGNFRRQGLREDAGGNLCEHKRREREAGSDPELHHFWRSRTTGGAGKERTGSGLTQGGDSKPGNRRGNGATARALCEGNGRGGEGRDSECLFCRRKRQWPDCRGKN